MKGDPGCTLCKLHSTCENVCIMGVGPRKADIMVIGEAPNRSADAGEDPLSGRSGAVLKRALIENDFDPDEVYITHAVHCRPPDNKTPTKTEIKACRHWLMQEIERVNPGYIILLGNTPLLAVLEQTGIKKLRGKPVNWNGRVVIPTLHPNMALHDDKWETIISGDIARVRECVEFGGIPEEKELNLEIVDTRKKVDALLKDLRGVVAVDLETTRLYPFTTRLDELVRKKAASIGETRVHRDTHNGNQPRVVSAQFGTKRKQWVLPCETAGIWDEDELHSIVGEITEALKDCYTIYHNGKFDALWMRVRFGVFWHVSFDTMLAHYLHDENDLHGLKYLAQKYLGVPDWDVAGGVKTSWSLKNAKYAAHDVFYTRKLYYILRDKLKEDEEVKQVFDYIMMPCVEMFVDAEYRGVYINVDQMDDAEAFLREQVAEAHAKLEVWGAKASKVDTKGANKGKINWGSNDQLGNLLFNDLGIDPIEQTAGGKNSVSESVLLRIDHPMVGDLLKWRAANKQLSSFIEGWKPYLDKKGRLHPVFKLHGTVTGRLSCEHPNLQQVPRDPRIRTLITAPKGWTLVEMDLSQIELRIAAELADEQNMLYAFNTGVDVHWLTAIREIERGGGYKEEIIDTAYMHKQVKMKYAEAVAYILKMGPGPACELMEMWKELRKKAKAINFGYLYGMWWKKFKIYARDNYGVTIDDEGAQASREAFFQLYPGFPAWHKRQGRFAKMHGYVRSLSGRKRRLPKAQGQQDTPERREAMRQAINSPVQSFANELNLMAALEMRERFLDKAKELGIERFHHLVGTVHDAVLFEVKDELLPYVWKLGLEIMSRPNLLTQFEIDLNVPIEAEAKAGPWGAGVGLDKWLKANPQVTFAMAA